MGFQGKRLVLGKLGLDAHDNGLRIVAKWLMDNGFEVIYTGLYNTTDRLVRVALEEDADAVGVSFLGGEYNHYANELKEKLRQKGMDHVKLIVGGVIPPDDVQALKSLGADEVFTPGTKRQAMMERLEGLFRQPAGSGEITDR